MLYEFLIVIFGIIVVTNLLGLGHIMGPLNPYEYYCNSCRGRHPTN